MMAYKDKDKQREANRAIQARRRAKGVTQGVTNRPLLGVTESGCDKGVTVTKTDSHVDASDVGTVKVLHQAIKPERTAKGNIRVSKPGDADYVPQCETAMAFIEDRDKRVEAMIDDVSKHGGEYNFKTVKGEIQDVHHIKSKRGKDIKCFEDLPPDVQATINRISESNEEKQKRTAAAIKYQHLFPNRYYSTGVV